METFSALLALHEGNSPVNSPHKGQWCRALMFSLIYAWINGWVNNRQDGDLKRHRAHYNVTVMELCCFRWQAFTWATDGQELQHHVATTDHTDLTHLPLDKMAAILANDNFKYIFLNENDRILIWISLKSVPKSPIDNKPALVQVMAWCWTGDKSLIEPMLTLFTDAYMRH